MVWEDAAAGYGTREGQERRSRDGRARSGGEGRQQQGGEGEKAGARVASGVMSTVFFVTCVLSRGM